MADIMNKKFDQLVIEKEKIETEMMKLGGVIYKNRNLLPSLTITADNLGKITSDLKMIQKICDQFSEDIVRLHADLFVHYGFNDCMEESQSNPIFSILNELAVPIVAKLGIAKRNAGDIAIKVNQEVSHKNESTLYGAEYCFISIILNEIFPIYTGLISLALGRLYFDENYLDVLKQRIGFLLHPSYEALRKGFKVVETLRMVSTPLKAATVH